MGKNIKIRELTKRFGRVKALDSLNLEIKAGEIFTLLGPSGCGKSTTLRLIAGLEEPDDGEISFGDQIVASIAKGIFVPAHKRNLGMVFQSYAIWPHMTVFENVAYPLKVRHVSEKKLRDRVFRILELVELTELASRPATQLSGGQQQRVAIARSLVHEPHLLLLDEPFSNLDAKLREQTRFQLKLLLRKLGITVVFVTHDQVEALSLSDRVAVINAGHVEQLGPPQQLYEAPTTTFVRDFLGQTVLLSAVVVDITFNRLVSVCLDGMAAPRLLATAVGDIFPMVNEKVFVAVRPEDLRILPISQDDGYTVVGSIDALQFVGSSYECRVKLGNGEKVLVYAPRSVKLAEKDLVKLKLPPEGIGVWPR